MRSFIDMIRKSRDTNSITKKKQALLELTETGKKLLKWTLDPFSMYGHPSLQVDYQASQVYDFLESTLVQYLEHLLTSLKNKTITGHVALARIDGILSMFTQNDREFIAMIIRKDLDCGIGIDTVNQVFPDLIYSFKCMLASPLRDFKKVTYPCLVEAKYDGLRVITMIKEGRVSYYSRTGKRLKALEGLFDYQLRTKICYNGILDGEVLGKSRNTTMSALGAMNDELRKELRYVIFDRMSLEEWENKSCKVEQADRSCHTTQTDLVKLPISTICNTEEELKSFYSAQITAGYEGVIIKKLTGKYQWKRSKNWLKLKLTETFDGWITGFNEGTGRLVNSLGALQVTAIDGTWTSECGSGMSDILRKEIWGNRENYLGCAIEIKAQGLTKSIKKDKKPSLDSPVLVRFRADIENK